MTAQQQKTRLARRPFLLGLASAAVAPVLQAACAEDHAAGSIRVMTYNIRYDNPGDGDNRWLRRRDAMGKFIAAEKIDIAGLQEVLIGQARDLEERLPEFAWYGLGRDDGMTKGELSPLFYRKDRFERLGEGTFWLSTTPDDVGSKGWDAALPRVCSWLKLRDKTGGSEWLAFNTHFDHRGEQARENSAALLRGRISTIAGGTSLVLTGDFNCTASDAPYETLTAKKSEAAATGDPLEDARAISSTEPAGPDSTWNGFRQIVPGRTIDFIFVRRAKVHGHRVLDPREEGRFLSDHLPVVAEISLAAKK